MQTDRLQSISGTYTAATEHKQRAFPAMARVYSDYLKHSPTQSIEPRVARNYSPKMGRRNQFEGLGFGLEVCFGGGGCHWSLLCILTISLFHINYWIVSSAHVHLNI